MIIQGPPAVLQHDGCSQTMQCLLLTCLRCWLQKQSIAVPEVRLVPDAEQDRRRRAIQYLQAQAAGKGAVANITAWPKLYESLCVPCLQNCSYICCALVLAGAAPLAYELLRTLWARVAGTGGSLCVPCLLFQHALCCGPVRCCTHCT